MSSEWQEQGGSTALREMSPRRVVRRLWSRQPLDLRPFPSDQRLPPRLPPEEEEEEEEEEEFSSALSAAWQTLVKADLQARLPVRVTRCRR